MAAGEIGLDPVFFPQRDLIGVRQHRSVGELAAQDGFTNNPAGRIDLRTSGIGTSTEGPATSVDLEVAYRSFRPIDPDVATTPPTTPSAPMTSMSAGSGLSSSR